MKPRIVLIHWKTDEAAERIARLKSAGFAAWHAPVDGAAALRAIRQDIPSAIAIDLSRLPSHGREVAIHLRRQKLTRTIPLIFVDGDGEKLDRLKSILPDAAYTTWPRIKSATGRAMKSSIDDPVAPKDGIAGYSGTPLLKKLGIKPAMIVGLTAPPADFAATLGELPAGARLLVGTSAKRRLTIWFVRSLRDLDKSMKKHVALAAQGPLWIAWPKKASSLASDVSETEVRRAGLSNGLVDYKICAIDHTWSGLLFCVRRAKG